MSLIEEERLQKGALFNKFLYRTHIHYYKKPAAQQLISLKSEWWYESNEISVVFSLISFL